MLEGEHAATDQRLAKLVAEIAGAVRGFYQQIDGWMIEPRTLGVLLLPRAGSFQARVARHVHSSAGQGHAAGAAGHAVANFAARSGSSAVERLYRSGEIVRLGFQRNHRLSVAEFKIGCGVLACRRKLRDFRPTHKSHVVFVG